MGPILTPLIYFYRTTTNTNILDTLRRSLADTLSVFYPLAGRVKDGNGIHCNDEGVPYVEAEVTDTRFEDIVHKADVFELDPLQPNEGHNGLSSLLLVIQVTTFPCGGLAIGLKINHLIADASAFVMFVNTWASIAKGRDPSTLVPRPYFHVWKVFPQHHANEFDGEPVDSANSLDLDSIKFASKPLSKRFMVSKDKLIALRAKLYDTSKDKTNVPSLTMVLSAFIWSRVNMIHWANNNTTSCLAEHAVSLHTKVEPPKNCYYFGNFLVKAVMLETNNSSDTNQACRHFLARMKESLNRVLSDDFIREIQQGREDLMYIKKMDERAARREIDLLKFSSIRRMPFSDADFGWGGPLWVSNGSWPIIGLVVLARSWVAEDMIEFCVSMKKTDRFTRE